MTTSTVACRTDGCAYKDRPCPVSLPKVGPWVALNAPLACTGCGAEPERLEEEPA